MPKRTLFTNITPLPAEVTREVAVAMLHDHDEMIELNPLVIEHHSIKTPRDAPADEFLDCVWQQLTDKVHYLPGGMVKGKVSYKACFHDLPLGLQTHIYAPLGLDIREKWSIGGSLPGEPAEARELGLDVPAQGLYIREDGDMHCSRFLTAFVRKNLDQAHKVLVERILKKAQRIERHRETMSHHSYQPNSQQPYQTVDSTSQSAPQNNSFQTGSHMAKSRIIHSPLLNQNANPPLSPTHLHPQGPNMMDHPAFRAQQRSSSSHFATTNPSDQRYSNAYPSTTNPQPTKQFVAELPGSYYHAGNLSTPPLDHRHSIATELSSQDYSRNSIMTQGYSDKGSSNGISDPITPVQDGYRYNPQDFDRPYPFPDDGMVKNNRVSELPAMEMEQRRQLR